MDDNEKIIKIIVYFLWILNLILFAFSCIAGMMSPMMFDAPGSTGSLLMWLAFTLVILVPIITFVMTILSVFIYKKKKLISKSLSFGMVPIVYTLIVILFFILSPFYK